MPTNKKYLARFDFGRIYHIYNRVNDSEALFKNDEDKRYFLMLFDHYLSPLMEVFAWSLLPNHFHFVVRIKNCDEILLNLDPGTKLNCERRFITDANIECLVSMSFKRMFISYSLSFNKLYQRKGNLFQRQFKRVVVEKDHQFTRILVYVHLNAQKHKIVDNIENYRWTSYHITLGANKTKLLRQEVLQWFGGREAFIKTHMIALEDHYEKEITVEGDD